MKTYFFFDKAGKTNLEIKFYITNSLNKNLTFKARLSKVDIYKFIIEYPKKK